MKTATKLALLAGIAAGYVLGSRAGRERYEQIAERAESVWNSKAVVKQRENVEDLVDAYVPSFVTSTAKGLGQIAGGVGNLVFGDGSKPKAKRQSR
ncbi:hypothetical protein [Gulosibacter faecalis]|jgi:hypothetical protein|uniref:YtxH domain-containing protein n=1 Tax=Gulosibacter faecalis TaxID=272240 RepID=A0ABW5UW49_9MICO|nr:hypothetical protein [Gulosibacter faecalis]